ncbi:MAG: alanine racemase [Saprospiraceae bacterium]|nr:alanine racemase [Saprospiraceae bacterium]
MIDFEQIIRPTLLIDKSRAFRNLKKLTDKAQKHQLEFRPHFKTHQSEEVGKWFREFGVTKITVSSVQMAKYFAGLGWQDITIAFPVNIRAIKEINQLAKKVQLHILVESLEVLDFLDAHLESKLGLFIKIDTGYHRTGVAANNIRFIDQLLKRLEAVQQANFMGFLVHSGHSYQCRSKEAIRSVHHSSQQQLKALRRRYLDIYPNMIISIGDTPTCSVADNFSAIDEIRAGNFVYYDLMQWNIGACDLDEIAVALACPIVAKHADRREVVIYGGGVHFSKERGTHPLLKTTYYGILVQWTSDSWKVINTNNYLKSVSQEHGVLRVEEDTFDQLKIGDVIGILPIHSCMTADLLRHTKDVLYISRDIQY